MRAENVNEEFARYTAQLKPNKTVLDLYNEILKDLQNERKGESKKEAAALQNELSTVQKRINSIEDKYLDGDLTKEQYNRMLERYTKEASAMQQQIEMRENPNRSNIEPKLGSVVILGGLIFVTSIYAYTFASLKRKNLISTTPLNDALNALILSLNASAAAFVLLFTKKFKILS